MGIKAFQAQPLARDTISHDTKPAVINYVAAIFAATGTFLFGYDSGIVSTVISSAFDHFHEYFNRPSSAVIGAIVAVFAGGAFFGAIAAGWSADKIGRKRTIQLAAVIAAIGSALQTGAVHVAMLILGRFVAGFAIGILSMIVPVYNAEIAPPHVRGLLSGWAQLMIGIGHLVANWVGYGSKFIDGPGQFRLPLGVQIIPAVLLFIGMFFLPYSPRWLAKQGRKEEAKETLFRLHGGAKQARHDIVTAEFEEMISQIDWERDNLSSSMKDLVNTRANLHRTACGVLIQAMCQWTGNNVIGYYGPSIYASLGFDGGQTLIINGVYSAWGVTMTFIFITFIVDKIGRRKPLLFSPFWLAACLSWNAAIGKSFQKKGYKNFSRGISGVAAYFCFSLGFNWSYGPVSWIYQSEIFPMNTRAMGTSISTCANWLNNVIISQVTPIGLEKLKWKFFMLFVSTNLLNSVFVYFLFPETKGRSLEEIGVLFGDENIRMVYLGSAEMVKAEELHHEHAPELARSLEA